MSMLNKSSNRPWRTEPTYVAKYKDDLWLGVKGQPRSDIAGFSRNLFQFLVTRPGDIRSENADMSNDKSCEKHDRLPVEGEDSEVGEHSAQRANMPGSGSVHLLTPFEALSSMRFSFRMSRSASRVYKPFSFQCSPFESSVGAFSLLIRVGVAREQSVPPCHSRESVYSRDCCHSQQG
nr:hypothetical protein [Tanacetum cinerariifolium]